MTKRRRKVIILTTVFGTLAHILVALWLYHTIAFIIGDYNSIMYKHLSNPENYKTIKLTYKCAYYYDKNEKIIINSSNVPDKIENYIYMEYIDILDDIQNSALYFKFEILQSNANVLLKNGFFNDVTEGSEITIRSSLWIYMDNGFNFIAGVEYGDKTYLDFEQGLNNIIKHMNENRMIF